MMVSSKVDFVPFRHSVLDTESSEFSHLWIPAFAGMTVFGLLTSSSSMKPFKMTTVIKTILIFIDCIVKNPTLFSKP
jgi:uncharacterized protein (DUF2062 family)